MPNQQLRTDIAVTAREWLGTPFVPCASLRNVGADCLGVVIGVLRECGREFNAPGYSLEPGEHDANQLLGALKSDFTRVYDPQPGHILLFRWRRLATHLGIRTENGFIHAYFPVGRVVEVPFSAAWINKLHSAWEAAR